MIKCQNCGNGNAPGANFCRFCGTKFNYAPQAAQAPPFDYEAPRPYGWKTDELTTHNEARRTASRIDHMGAPHGQLEVRHANLVGANYRCPMCMSPYLPILERKISTGGWVTFGLLLVFFFPLFWVGLLMKEDARVCPSCKSRVG